MNREHCPTPIAIISGLLVALSLVPSCGPPPPPVCQTAAGAYARLHGLSSVSISCARATGDQTPCTLSYGLPGRADEEQTIAQSITLMCGRKGCSCVGGCP